MRLTFELNQNIGLECKQWMLKFSFFGILFGTSLSGMAQTSSDNSFCQSVRNDIGPLSIMSLGGTNKMQRYAGTMAFEYMVNTNTHNLCVTSHYFDSIDVYPNTQINNADVKLDGQSNLKASYDPRSGFHIAVKSVRWATPGTAGTPSPANCTWATSTGIFSGAGYLNMPQNNRAWTSYIFSSTPDTVCTFVLNINITVNGFNNYAVPGGIFQWGLGPKYDYFALYRQQTLGNSINYSSSPIREGSTATIYPTPQCTSALKTKNVDLPKTKPEDYVNNTDLHGGTSFSLSWINCSLNTTGLPQFKLLLNWAFDNPAGGSNTQLANKYGTAGNISAVLKYLPPGNALPVDIASNLPIDLGMPDANGNITRNFMAYLQAVIDKTPVTAGTFSASSTVTIEYQ